MIGAPLTDVEPPRHPRPASALTDPTRWQRLPLRSGDVIISTPSKSGTTWTQQLVGMLLLDEIPLETPISEISPWVDMLVRTDEQLLADLAAQTHRRFLKTHTPIDALPWHPELTFVSVARHPLDVAMSDLDHMRNQRNERLRELQQAVTGQTRDDHPWTEPDDITEYLREFISTDEAPDGAGAFGLARLIAQILTAWEVRWQPNVWLLHYSDLWDDLDGELRLLAAFLDVEPPADRWPALVRAGTLDAMRERADRAAPEAHLGFWKDDGDFFASGGRRGWADHLTTDDLTQFSERLRELAGDAAPWIEGGWRAVDEVRPPPRPAG